MQRALAKVLPRGMEPTALRHVDAYIKARFGRAVWSTRGSGRQQAHEELHHHLSTAPPLSTCSSRSTAPAAPSTHSLLSTPQAFYIPLTELPHWAQTHPEYSTQQVGGQAPSRGCCTR